MYCASSVKIMRVPQAISQLFAILHSGISEVIYKFRDRALSVHIDAYIYIYSWSALSGFTHTRSTKQGF